MCFIHFFILENFGALASSLYGPTMKLMIEAFLHLTKKVCMFVYPLFNMYLHNSFKLINGFHSNEEQIISGCPIDGAISVWLDCGFGSYRWFVYITTLLMRDASWILILHCWTHERLQRHIYC